MEENLTSSKPKEHTQEKRYNYIVGIDFGTYSTSLSFVHIDHESDIQTIKDWKQTNQNEFGGRVASTIIYKQENSAPLWGGSAHKRFYHEKDDFFYAPHIKLYLTDAENQPILPGNLTVVKLVSDYLKELHGYGLEQMKAYYEKKNEECVVESIKVADPKNPLGSECNKPKFEVTEDQIRYIFSYPDNQDDGEYTKTLKEALEMAGIINSDDPEHRLRFIQESRATAYFCSNMSDGSLKPSKKPYLVCDIGGEVFGLSTIKAEELSETGTVETHIKQAVAGCGNLKLDKSMRKYLEEKVTTSSEDTTTLELFRRRLFDYFVENIKLLFSDEDVNSGYIYSMEEINNTGSTIESDCIENGVFIFPYEDMKSYVFDPVTGTILECIEKAIRNFDTGISGIFLSGVIGNDNYLLNLVSKKFGNADVKVHSIQDRAFVVSKGLIYYGIRERGLMIPYQISKETQQKNKIRKPGNDGSSPASSKPTGAIKINQNNIDYIIGLDFGTTYSGFAYAPVPKTEEEAKKSHTVLIKDVKVWPKQTHGNYPKVPSMLYYSQDMKYLKKFGHEAKLESSKRNANGVLLRHFKLLLSRDFNPYVDYKELKDLDDFNLVDAIANYLRDLNKEGLARMKREGHTIKEDKLSFIVTIPAMWPDEAKNTMRAAVKKAEIVKSNSGDSNLDDRVHFITEAEAAALYCEKYFQDEFRMDQQQRFMICDAGGGTVDLVTFEVGQEEGEDGKPVISEITSGDGDNCGSVYVDENFKAHILKKFIDCGIRYTDKGIESIVEQFIREVKPNFEPSLNPDMEDEIKFEIPMSLGTLPAEFSDETGFIEDNSIIIPYSDMENYVFKPVVDQVLNLIDRQLRKLPEGERQIDAILVVGGFGQSLYLHSKILERFENKAIGAVFIGKPPDGDMSICRGAVSFGLDPRMVSKGITRYTYGLQVRDKFKNQQDDPSQKVIGYDGTDYCQNVFSEIVSKETTINKGTVYVIKTFVIYPNNPIFAIYSTDDKESGSNLRRLVSEERIQPISKLMAKMPEIKGVTNGEKVYFDLHVEITGTTIKADIYHDGKVLTEEVVDKYNTVITKKKFERGTEHQKKKSRWRVSIFFRSK